MLTRFSWGCPSLCKPTNDLSVTAKRKSVQHNILFCNQQLKWDTIEKSLFFLPSLGNKTQKFLGLLFFFFLRKQIRIRVQSIPNTTKMASAIRVPFTVLHLDFDRFACGLVESRSVKPWAVICGWIKNFPSTEKLKAMIFYPHIGWILVSCHALTIVMCLAHSG